MAALTMLASNSGAQDKFITHDPESTYFKKFTKKYGNFSIETQHIAMDKLDSNTKTYKVAIPRSGDLLKSVALKVTNAGNATITSSLFQMIDTASLEIGGTEVDKLYGTFKHAAHKLLNGHVEKTPGIDPWDGSATGSATGGSFKQNEVLYIPLDFFFSRHASLALPLISLAFHDVNVILKLNQPKATNVLTAVDLELVTTSMYLDEQERAAFSSASHELIIPQLQKTTGTAVGNDVRIPLPFNHPVNFLLWRQETKSDAHDGFLPGGADLTKADTAQLLLNHHSVFGREAQPLSWFRDHVPKEYFSASPNDNTFVHSFALNPHDLKQPSGSVNFSRITDAVLEIKFNAATAQTFEVFAKSWNVLSIAAGMGGLKFSS
tara:strand:- start:537 stop:1670 length:1134 start_codon:yes stop_codon:yes gene_type:complete